MSGSVAVPIPGGALPTGGPAAPLIGGPIEDTQAGTTRPTFAETLDVHAQDLEHGLTAGLFRGASQYDAAHQAPSDAEQQSWWPQPDRNAAPFAQPATPRPQIAAEDANEQNKAAGGTLEPYAPGMTVDQPTFAAQLTDNLTEQKRQKIISDHATGILSGAQDFGVSALTAMLDPLNDAAMLVPGAPEAWTARAIAEMGGGLAARIVGRAGAGALQGAAGMAALQPLQAQVASQDQMDFDWGNALRQVALGGAIGAVGGAIHGGLNPETKEAVLKGAFARVMTDDPRGVDVQGLIDHADASQAANNLETFQKKQAAIDAERTSLEQGPAPNRAGDIAEAQGRMEDAYVQERQFRREAGAVTDAQPVTTDADPVTQARLDEIEAELNTTIPKARQASLMREQDMLTEGLHPGLASDITTSPESLLEVARSQAQREGLTAAAERARATGQAAEADVARIQKEEAAAQAARASSDRATRIRQFQLDGTEAATQGMMEKEVRRYAAKTADANGTPLEPAEVTRIAKEIRTAGNGEVQDTIAHHLNTVARRSDAFPVRESLDRAAAATANLRLEAQGAAADMATRALAPADPELDRTQRNGANLVATQPKLEGIDVAKDSTEAGQMVADVKSAYDAAVARGDIAEHPSLADAGKDELARGDAEKAYLATCGFGAL